MTRSGKKAENKIKKDKIDVDILPYSANTYLPRENDTIIGVIVGRNPEFFTVDIGSDSHVNLSTLEFQNATRKEKPNYIEGTLIYCRVLSCDHYSKV